MIVGRRRKSKAKKGSQCNKLHIGLCYAVLQIDALNPASIVLKEQQREGTKLMDALEKAVKVQDSLEQISYVCGPLLTMCELNILYTYVAMKVIFSRISIGSFFFFACNMSGSMTLG